MKSGPTRRAVLQTGAAGVVAGGLASRVHATGSDTLKIALIGCGGRGTDAVLQALSTQQHVVLHAMADAFEDRLEISRQLIRKQNPQRFEVSTDRMFVGFDAYRRAIDSGVDGVILTTPPGFRPVHFEYAAQQGKHVFMEKPVATDAPGIRRVLSANEIALQKNLKVVVGLQRRFDPRYTETVRRVRDGAIGEIQYMRCYWDGGPIWVKPKESGQGELEHQMRNWYYFTWLSGDHIVEQHMHNLDVCNWVMGATPQLASSHAGRQVRTGKEFGEIYDHHAVEFTYEKRWDLPGVRLFSYCRQIADTFGTRGEHVYGTGGYANLGGFTIYDRNGERVWRYDHRRDASLAEPGNPYQNEHDTLWHAVSANESLNNVQQGAEATMTAILGRVAGYSGRLVKWDQALESGHSLVPENLTWNSPPPVTPKSDGTYEIPMPGKWDKF